MPRARPLPSQLPDVFTVPAARNAGVSRRRLRARDLGAPFRGVRTRKRSRETWALVRAYAVKLRPGEHYSHATALMLVGGWVPDRLRTKLDVSAVRPVGRPRGAGIRGHEAKDPRVYLWHGVPVVHPADAWCQLAGELSERELIIAADALLRRKDPILKKQTLVEAVERRAGCRGIRRLRRALARVRARTDSVAETELRLDAEAAGLPEFEVNGEIFDEHGKLVAVGDLVDRARKVLLEYDGEQHRTDDRQYARDIDRLEALAQLEWRVIRVNKRHRGRRRAQAIEQTRRALLARGWIPD
ncbi:hypothetical protein [Microbacterium sp.]|uniref:hypothetical protein n=1 Tax=Microbacterium sp. TaxID=51671 RepID=UPI003C741680